MRLVCNFFKLLYKNKGVINKGEEKYSADIASEVTEEEVTK